jgi:hypothetical protein
MHIHGILQSLNFSATQSPVQMRCSALAERLELPVDADGLMLQCEFWASSRIAQRLGSRGTLRHGAIEKNQGVQDVRKPTA